VASDSGATVALDLEITEELRRAGLARDAIRLIQEARKNSGLDVADRIALRWTSTDPAVVAALTEHAGLIADEVLATAFSDEHSAQGEADDTYGDPFTDEGLSLTFRLRKM
jgi:isoleucyl-tRNA synthetase